MCVTGTSFFQADLAKRNEKYWYVPGTCTSTSVIYAGTQTGTAHKSMHLRPAHVEIYQANIHGTTIYGC